MSNFRRLLSVRVIDRIPSTRATELIGEKGVEERIDEISSGDFGIRKEWDYRQKGIQRELYR